MRGAAPIVAELTGSDTCTAAGITVTAYAPVLSLCRSLLAAGIDPDTALDVFRGATMAMRVPHIGEAAKLTVKDDRHGTPVFRRIEKPPAGVATAPPMRLNGRAVP